MKRASTSLAIAALATSIAYADAPPESQRNFVSCPIVRDTATVPCWLSEYAGELYYLGIQTDVSADFDPPFLGHPVLVEGTVSDQSRICGGIVLDPVVIAPLAEFDANCNTILPAEDRYTVPFAPRPPGPSGGRLAFQREAVPEAVLEEPYESRDYPVHYDFDMLIMGRHAPILGDVLDYATRIGASRIEVIGSSGATLLSDGNVMAEDASIALKRANEIAEILKAGGLGDFFFLVLADQDRQEPDGRDDWRSRRAVIRVVP